MIKYALKRAFVLISAAHIHTEYEVPFCCFGGRQMVGCGFELAGWFLLDVTDGVGGVSGSRRRGLGEQPEPEERPGERPDEQD